MCGKASGEEKINEHIFGACTSVICVKPDETSRGITVGAFMAVICIWQNIQIRGIRALSGMMQNQLREGTSKNTMD